jgi:glycosyltransferase involved in cell wall biosynthesis
MKIALFHNLPSGGAKRAVSEWVRRLTTKHDIDVYTLSTADMEYCDLREYSRNHKVYYFQTRKLFQSPLGRLNQYQRWCDLQDLDNLNKNIAADIDTGGYDIVFTNTCMFTFIPALLRHLETPSVYYLHEPFGQGYTHYFERPYFRSKTRRQFLDKIDPLIHQYHTYLESLQRDSLSRTTRVLANSQFTKVKMESNFGIKSFLCPLGVDIKNFQILPEIRKENFIISVGEMSPRKGFDFIVESVGQIPLEIRPQLILACNSVLEQERQYIHSLADLWGVELKVFTHLNTKELRELYNKALLCVYAPVLEPFGLVPLEAMACGTPVIGVREGGVQESLVHELTGLLVDRDACMFGTAIEWLLTEPDRARGYGCNGRKHVEANWTWERSVAILERYLLETVGRSHYSN